MLVKHLNLVNLPQDALCVAYKFLSLGSQHHALGTSVEDGDAEISFKLLDGTADIGLGDEQGLSRLVEGAETSDLDGVLHVKYIHTDINLPPS